jgi:hypothetical protein
VSAWFASGRIADVALVLMCIEALGLLVFVRRRHRRRAAAANVSFMGAPRMGSVGLLANLAAGACLVLALRAALKHDSWLAVAGFLSAALVAHIVDVVQRVR